MITIKYLINEVEYEYSTTLTDDAAITDEIMQIHDINDSVKYCVTWYKDTQ